MDLRATTKSFLARLTSFNNKVTLTGAGPIPPYRGVSRTIWVEPGQRLTSEDVDKTTLKTSEEDVDKATLETSKEDVERVTLPLSLLLWTLSNLVIDSIIVFRGRLATLGSEVVSNLRLIPNLLADSFSKD